MSEKGELIPEEDFEKIAEMVPEGIKGQFKGAGKEHYKTLNQRLAKLKGLNALHFIIGTGKAMGKKDSEIAKEIGCCAATVARHKKTLQNSDYMKEVFSSLWDFVPMFKQSLRYLAAKGDAFTTVKFFEGMGIWSKKEEITLKVSKTKMQEKMKQNIKDILGVNLSAKPVNRIEGLIQKDE